MKKTREFHDNKSENISGESIRGFGAYSRAALINFFVPDAALIRGRRLIEGGAYSSKYGIYCGSELAISSVIIFRGSSQK